MTIIETKISNFFKILERTIYIALIVTVAYFSFDIYGTKHYTPYNKFAWNEQASIVGLNEKDISRLNANFKDKLDKAGIVYALPVHKHNSKFPFLYHDAGTLLVHKDYFYIKTVSDLDKTYRSSADADTIPIEGHTFIISHRERSTASPSNTPIRKWLDFVNSQFTVNPISGYRFSVISEKCAAISDADKQSKCAYNVATKDIKKILSASHT